MVSIAVIAVLIAITAPSIAGARASAEKTQCASVLSGLAKAKVLWSEDNQGRLPSVSEGPEKIRVIEWGWNGYTTYPVEEISLWAYPLREYLGVSDSLALEGTWDKATGAPELTDRLACPSVARRGRMRAGDEVGIDHLPILGASASYEHSIALSTDPRAWRSGRVVNVDPIYNPKMPAAAIAHPSSKADLAEAASNHGSALVRLGEDNSEVFNVLATDGHVMLRRPQDARTAIPFFGNGIAAGKVIDRPFLSNPGGISGLDW